MFGWCLRWRPPGIDNHSFDGFEGRRLVSILRRPCSWGIVGPVQYDLGRGHAHAPGHVVVVHDPGERLDRSLGILARQFGDGFRGVGFGAL